MSFPPLTATLVRAAVLIAVVPVAAYAKGDVFIPEPATILLLGVGGVALGIRKVSRAGRRRPPRPSAPRQ